MRKLSCCLVALTLFISGCGSGAADGITKASADTMNELAITIEGVKDDTSAASAAAQADQLGARIKELRNQLDALNISRDEKVKLARKYDLAKAEDRMKKALLALTGKKNDHFDQVNGALIKYEIGFRKVGIGTGTK